jgi:hypothetical protein
MMKYPRWWRADSLAKRNLGQLTALAKTQLKRMQYRLACSGGSSPQHRARPHPLM